jgi:hypothetical protein
MGGEEVSDVRYIPLSEEGFQRLKHALPEGTQWESLETLPRAVVMRFAREMERKLVKNDYKGGWEKMATVSLIRRLKMETKELEQAVHVACDYCNQEMKSHKTDVSGECADVANFALMVFDNESRKAKA